MHIKLYSIYIVFIVALHVKYQIVSTRNVECVNPFFADVSVQITRGGGAKSFEKVMTEVRRGYVQETY